MNGIYGLVINSSGKFFYFIGKIFFLRAFEISYAAILFSADGKNRNQFPILLAKLIEKMFLISH